MIGVSTPRPLKSPDSWPWIQQFSPEQPSLMVKKRKKTLTTRHSYFNFYHLPRWLSGKGSFCQCRKHRRRRFDLWVRKIPWKRKRNPLQHPCLGNPMDRGAWRATVWGIAKSWTWLSNLACTHLSLKSNLIPGEVGNIFSHT